MQSINSLLQIPPARAQKNIRSERDEHIQRFTDRINDGRKGTSFKPITPQFVAIKLSHIPTTDLYGNVRGSRRR